MITQINTASVYVRDQDRALEFYVDKLGFEKRSDEVMGEGIRWITVAPSGAQTALVLYQPTADNTSPDQLTEWQSRIGSYTNLVLSASDILDTVERLKERGVQFTMDPVPQPWGTFAMFVDPDGNSFMVVENIEGQTSG